MSAAVIGVSGENEIYSELIKGMVKIERELVDMKVRIFLKHINSNTDRELTAMQKNIVKELNSLMMYRDSAPHRHNISSLIDEFWDLQA